MAGSTFARLGELASQRWGLVTTAQALEAGVARPTLTRLANSGARIRVARGVYRLAGAPEHEQEAILATWLALGGADRPRTDTGVPPVVAAGQTAAQLHGIGDWFPGPLEFVVPTRRGTRLDGVRLRTRELAPTEVVSVDGMPTMSVERTIADLIEQWVDRSLVADALADAADAGKLLSPARLTEYLEPLAKPNKYPSGAALAADLLALAGVDAVVPADA